jgi:hypothetical protein
MPTSSPTQTRIWVELGPKFIIWDGLSWVKQWFQSQVQTSNFDTFISYLRWHLLLTFKTILIVFLTIITTMVLIYNQQTNLFPRIVFISFDIAPHVDYW